jgi:hypothetical protein
VLRLAMELGDANPVEMTLRQIGAAHGIQIG